MNEFWSFITERYPDILLALRQHLTISFSAVILGTIVAVPIGILLVYNRVGWINSAVFFIANLFQTIPSLALLAILIPLLGIGVKPAILALLLYSLMPILRNTYDGFQSVDKGVLNSAKGMGYSAAQTILKIQLPLSLPYIMSGIRITTVYIISWATLASLIGAGGLGQLIVSGLGVNKPEMIFIGGIGAVVLALVADGLLGLLEGWLTRRYRQTRSAAV
ncbi:ABC transporter permease [Paenibacillus cellulositrophicus]|uniref:Choline ABC transporter permease n=2 Tax=Paenibacillus TaxID=44249 RepID=A0ABQ4LPA3_9BACL|nr:MULTISPECIES: ABC transporter permease [Paenibacillus]MCM3001986.1 ABC transporter permease [Paenibacillus cellulositrophicus]MEC0176001.1 ABC transporter permease [Paenibacillus favisporus]RED31745.1 osmoprotectant transport system permease protein [Paenibacillus sp. VMFN-D1]GIO58080.1 choline ABC transporter permease [Paenibacillus cineris]